MRRSLGLAVAVAAVLGLPAPALADRQGGMGMGAFILVAAGLDLFLPQAGLAILRDGTPAFEIAYRWVGPSVVIGADRDGRLVLDSYVLSPAWATGAGGGRSYVFLESAYELGVETSRGWERHLAGLRGGLLFGRGTIGGFRGLAVTAGAGAVSGARGFAATTYWEAGVERRRGHSRVGIVFRDYGNHARYARGVLARVSFLL